MRSLFNIHPSKLRLPGKSGLSILLAAAMLIVLTAGAQYFYTHGMMEKELERRAESELTMKAILIKGMLGGMENALRDHSNDVLLNKAHPDSMFSVASRLLRAHPNIVGAGIAFVPYYYPSEGRLFEPWAGRHGSERIVMQLAGDDHDYTQMSFYQEAMSEQGAVKWCDPYVDVKGGLGLITTAVLSVRGDADSAFAVMGADISLDWLGDTINDRHMYPSSYNMLLSEDGSLIAGPSPELVSAERVAKVVALINDSSAVRRSSHSNHSKIVSFSEDSLGRASIFHAYMRGHPHWQMAVVCYDREVYGKLHTMGLNILILSLLAIALLGYIVYRSAKDLRKLGEVRMAQERLDSELHVARNIQAEMVPTQYPPFPERTDVDIIGLLEPAKAVGGDLYDYFIRDEKLFFCIGDVSGKGVPSALVMAVTHSLFRSAGSHESNPARIIHTINEASSAGNNSNMFVTLFLGVLDLPTGRLRYCNAGHGSPVAIDTEVHELPVTANLPVGLFADFEYKAQEAYLKPDTLLFLYTDGLTEARSPQRELYGQQRVMDALSTIASQQLSPTELLTNMKARVRDFIDMAEQSDDLTMLALKYKPATEKCLLHESVELTNNVTEIERLGNAVKSLAQRLGMEKGETARMRLAVEEAVVNIISYAYPDHTQGTITVDFDVIEDEVAEDSHSCTMKTTITDAGAAFDPTQAEQADTTLPTEERPIGGLGILLVRELMDVINYERIDGHNILTLKKHLTIKRQTI